MSKPSYEDLVNLIRKIYRETKIESVVSVEWANYPIEVFDELAQIHADLDLKNE